MRKPLIRPPSPGGVLTPIEVVDGYSAGLFLWPVGEGNRNWFLPEMRTLLPIEGIRLSRSLRRRIARREFEIRFDTDLAGVLSGCARAEGTWITAELQEVYLAMHRNGVHSVEAWDEGELVGGLYGLALGGVFFAESMFHRRTDAGKVALAAAVEHCRSLGFTLFDVQLTTDHLLTLGAYELPASEFMERAKTAFAVETNWSIAATASPSFAQMETFSQQYGCSIYLT